MKFHKDIPYIPKGLDLKRYIFSGGRVFALMADHGGLTQITYYGEQRFGDAQLYKSGDSISAWFQIFRLCLSIGDNIYYMEFSKTHMYPFGYSSECTFEGVLIRHELSLLNDALVYRIRILKNSKNKKVAAAILHMDGATRMGKPTRKWGGFEWVGQGKVFLNQIIDQYPEVESQTSAPYDPLMNNRFPTKEVDRSETYVAVISDRPLHLRHLNSSQKHNIYTEAFDHECLFTVVFGHSDANRFMARVKELRKSAGLEADQLLKSYLEGLRDQPSIGLNDPAVQSFAANARAILDCVKIKDIPGCIRAANSNYWMWGWDSLVHNQVFDLLHDNSFSVDILALFRKYYDPNLGLFHQAMTNMKPCLSMHYSVQGLYALALYDAYLLTGDRKLLETYFDFAKKIVDRAAEDEVRGSGLLRGVGVYPDAVAQLDQTGDDIAAINNSIYYQVLRAMQSLAGEMGRTEIAKDFKSRADRLLANFHRLYDSEKGFFYDSISASDFLPRKHYVVHAILWLTPFARDLVEGREKEICRFMVTHLRAKHGFRLMPKWDTRYMADGNNQGYYDPYNERFFREMMKSGKNREGITEYFSNVSWCWNQLTVPEGLSAEAENNGSTLDNLGGTLPFSTKAWYSTLVNTMAGLDLDCEGISFSACDAPDLHIKNLTIRGHKVDVEITGKGWKIGKLQLNGKSVKAPFKISYASLKKQNKVKLTRI